MSEITLKIDGQKIDLEKGKTLLQACQDMGLDIPTLCYHPRVEIAGACRLCMVEDKKSGQLVASCALEASEGMEIETESPRVIEARRVVLDLLLASHDVDCFACERNGDCRLQDYAYRYGIEGTSFSGEKPEFSVEDDNPFFERDYNRCIQCGLCVRACHEIPQVGAIDFANRGFASQVATPFQVGLEESTCVFCGRCIEMCPVGALTPRLDKFAGRPWEIKKTRTTCSYCGVGCQIELRVKDDQVIGVDAFEDTVPNYGDLCVKGKFGWDYIHHPDRLTAPLIRKEGELVPVSWEEALDYTVQKLKSIKEEHGGKALGGLTSAKCTNEENYLFQKFVRTALATHNIDHCARL